MLLNEGWLLPIEVSCPENDVDGTGLYCDADPDVGRSK